MEDYIYFKCHSCMLHTITLEYEDSHWFDFCITILTHKSKGVFLEKHLLSLSMHLLVFAPIFETLH